MVDESSAKLETESVRSESALSAESPLSSGSLQTLSLHGGKDGSSKPPRKRKRKGLGNWTRTTMACNRCRKMKIRCDDVRPCSNCKRWSHECVTTQTEASVSKLNDPSSQDSLRKRIQRIETLLHGKTPTTEQPQRSLSSALAGIEKFLGIPPPDSSASPKSKQPILMPSTFHESSVPSPNMLPSPATSHVSQLHQPFLGEANHKRWGAESAVGQSWSKISAMDPRLQTLASTLGLPGADEPPKQLVQRRVLGEFPSLEYSMELFDAYCEYVSPIVNIIHPPTVKTMIETVSRDGAQSLTSGEQALLLMIFALGALIKNDGKSEQFYKLAASNAFEVVNETTTESASTAFLLGLYQQTTGRISAAWTTMGVVVRIAMALGYHRNVSHWGLSSFHQEFRRRIWANIYIMDAYQSVVYGRPPIIQDAECDVDPPSTAIDDADMSPDMPVPSVGDGLPKQMDFHLAFYKLCRITHRMMKRLYLNVESKFDTWETIRSITEQLQEFRVSLPKHLRIEHVREDQDDIICRQAIFLDFFISHILNIACRPLLVHRQATSVGPAVAQHRRTYCQDVAVTASNHLASMMDYRHRCGFLARMLFSASGIFLTAAEVLALHAIVSPKDSPASDEAYKNLNKLLALFVYSDRAGPFTAQSMSILQDLIRLVVRINEQRKSMKSIPPSPTQRLDRLNELGEVDEDNVVAESLFSEGLLNDFLNTDPFPSLAMDDMIWMPEKSMSSVWGNMGEWKDFI